MSKINYNTSEYNIIYTYSLPDVTTHEGHVKVGKANIKLSDYALSKDKDKAVEAAARKRIKDQLGTPDIDYILEDYDLAIKKSGESFLDHDVHNVLKRSGIPNVVHTENKKRGEWFATNNETVKKAIEAVKNGYSAIDTSSIVSSEPITFRKGSQPEAIEKTIKAIQKGKKHFLWDAKMRFGKTLTALEVARRMNYGKVLIITHRPEVSEDWFNDFNKLLAGNYKFGSRDKGENIKNLQNGYLKSSSGAQANPFVYFASVQYLRHEVKSAEKLAILSEKWDMVIIDEADEGIKTALADETISPIPRDFTLMLSGTPFNLLEDYKEDEIYSWDYTAEQELKARWDELYPDEPNPYYKLPKLSIFTYNLNKYLPNTEFENLYDKAFNFKEFFRTDKEGNFVHEKYVKKFLDLISTDQVSNFPYSTIEYRKNLRHTLWMMPGVKEARALEKLLNDHPVFTHFEIANVAGDGNEEVPEKKSRELVKKAITNDPLNNYSITLSCGKMTRGVSVPEWSAVFMLSNTTSASTYLQTIFRGQTPWEVDGQLKTECFVFDFAPDRTLNVVAEVMKIKKKKPTTDEVKEATSKFLNFCPVISATDGEMRPFSSQKLLHAIKKVAIQKVTRNGFDDTTLYNLENLSKCSDEDLADFDALNNIIGKSTGVKNDGKIKMADNGFTDEEIEQVKQAKQKKKEKIPLTPEQEEMLRRDREIKEQRKTRISILRGVSIRMPMLIYGIKSYTDSSGVEREIAADSEISLEHFIDFVDDDSWAEFMPKGVTKQMLREKFAKYYDEEVFIGAGIDIRLRALAADELAPSERVAEIGEIFKGFKNPDKETVLTPWRVVNMHLSSTLGGSNFNDIIEFDSERDQKGEKIGLPNWINQGEITNIWSDKNAKVLEINSKSGLYPLLSAYNFYDKSLAEAVKTHNTTEENIFKQLWNEILKRNIFVLTKSPMAKTITERTLAGYTGAKTNVVYIPDLISKLKAPTYNLLDELKRKYNLEGDEMKFTAVVGNPPYQIGDEGKREDGSVNASASPIYHLFAQSAEQISDVQSIIMPARWLSGAGKGLDQFTHSMLNKKSIRSFSLYTNSTDVFPNVDIKGGVCFFVNDNNYIGRTNITINSSVGTEQYEGNLNSENSGIFIPFKELVSILGKVKLKTDDLNLNNMQNLISVRKPYGLSTDFFKDPKKYGLPALQIARQKDNDIEIVGLDEGKRSKRFAPYDYPIKIGIETIDKWKVFAPYAYGAGALGENGPTPMLGSPMQICTETFLRIGNYDTKLEADNTMKYYKTKFLRVMVGILKTTQHSTTTYKFVPLQDFTTNSDIDWSKSIPEIDQQLYRKYNLTSEEIDFIETRVKAME